MTPVKITNGSTPTSTLGKREIQVEMRVSPDPTRIATHTVKPGDSFQIHQRESGVLHNVTGKRPTLFNLDTHSATIHTPNKTYTVDLTDTRPNRSLLKRLGLELFGIYFQFKPVKRHR